MENPNISDPYHPDYDSEARDQVMNLVPFYDPHHKCNIVREDVFKRCLEELRQRERKARGISKNEENKDPAICPKCGTERVYYDGWNCPTEGIK